MRSILSIVYRPPGIVTDRHDKYRPLIDRLKISRSAGLFLPARYCGRCGRYFQDF
jgi:hypothetical protein